MGFNLDRAPREIHHEIQPGVLVIGDQDCPIMAVFRTIPTNRELDDFIVGFRTLGKKFDENPDKRVMEDIQAAAARVFVGWVNPEGREDLWVRKAGQPVEATPETVEQFLECTGVASVICREFVEAMSLTGSAAVGNSKPSHGNGFVDRVKALDSSTAPTTLAP